MKAMLTILLLLCTVILAYAEYEPAIVHVIYYGAEVTAVTAAEFRIADLPLPQCTITEHWNTSLVIGDLSEGIAMAFSPPLTGPYFYLGYLEFIAWEPIDDDYYFYVTETNDTGVLLIVDGDFNSIDVGGGGHTFNCSDEYMCTYYCWHTGGEDGAIGLSAEDDDLYQCYQDIEVFSTPVEKSSFSAMKSLY